jgi:hypothetical protein
MAGIGAAAAAAAHRTLLSQQLVKAAEAGLVCECTRLSERKADVHYYTHDIYAKKTALHYAARAGKRDACAVLLDAKADLEA